MELSMPDLHIVSYISFVKKMEKQLHSNSSQVPELDAHWATLP